MHARRLYLTQTRLCCILCVQPPRPFYSVARIGPQLPPQRLSALRQQLFRSIKTAYSDWRTTRSLRTRWANSLEVTLDQVRCYSNLLPLLLTGSNTTNFVQKCVRRRGILWQGLQVLETASCSSSITEARAVDKWRGQLLAALPPDYKFIGRAFSFSLTTPELVVRSFRRLQSRTCTCYPHCLTPPRDQVDHLMSCYDYHTNGHKEAVFALAVQCFPHYGAVASTWVYVGVLTPHAKKKKKGERED